VQASQSSSVNHGPVDEARRRAFGQALGAAMRAADVKAPQVAAVVDLTADAVRKWLEGRSEPAPLTVFAVERLLEVPPGDISRHLGYVPAESPSSVIEAIEADPALSVEAREIVTAAYRSARRRG